MPRNVETERHATSLFTQLGILSIAKFNAKSDCLIVTDEVKS